ncbi:hypothetical protein ACES2L_15745 [Bdellovibrio bacteriovorus]
MQKLFVRSLIVLFLSGAFQAQASVSLSADANTVSEKAHSIESEYSQNMRDERLSTSYASTLKMRDHRKVGAGFFFGGSSGMAGLNLELNFEDADGVLASFGQGPGYDAFQLSWKHAFEGDYLAPYTTLGYSRWYNSDGGRTRNSDILDRVLTTNEKKSGQFGTNFINTSFGIQYNQLSGELAGMSFYGELTGMYEVSRSMLIPNGSVGALYYF